MLYECGKLVQLVLPGAGAGGGAGGGAAGGAAATAGGLPVEGGVFRERKKKGWTCY